MDRYELSPKSKMLIRKMRHFNLIWCTLSIGILLLFCMAGISHFGVVQGAMLSFIFGGEGIFHYRMLDKIQKICNERHPCEPWKAQQEYKAHRVVVTGLATIGVVGILVLIVSLITLWAN